MTSRNVSKIILGAALVLLAVIIILLRATGASVPPRADFGHEDAGTAVSIRPQKEHFVFGIRPLPNETYTTVSESSRVELRIDGRRIGELRLGDSFPHLDLHLAPGLHRLEFTADIYANDSVSYDGNCTTTLEVGNQPMTLRPWFDFTIEPTESSKGHLSICQLIEW